MARAMLTGQYLPSGAGFKVIRIDDVSKYPEDNKNFHDLKKWCRQNCSGIWGFTPYATVSIRQDNPAEDVTFQKNGGYYITITAGYQRSTHYNEHYFAFVDPQDITMIALYLGLDSSLSLKAMWPSKCKFIIYYDTSLDEEVQEYDPSFEDPAPDRYGRTLWPKTPLRFDDK